MRIAFSACVLVLAAMVLTTGACGGSGPSVTIVPAGPQLYSGSYFIAYLSGNDGATDVVTCDWGISTSAGLGSLTVDALKNSNAVVTGPFNWGSIPYTIDAARAYKWQAGSNDVQSGGISADGRVGVGATSFNGWDPAINLMIRREGTFSLGSLNGAYHLCDFGFDPLGAGIASWGTATFNGAGVVTAAFSTNTEGTVAGGGGGPGTYTVLLDGTTTLSTVGETWEGGILLGGDLVVLAGGDATGQNPKVTAAIRQSTNASLATATGTYFIVGLERNSGSFASVTGTAKNETVGPTWPPPDSFDHNLKFMA